MDLGAIFSSVLERPPRPDGSSPRPAFYYVPRATWSRLGCVRDLKGLDFEHKAGLVVLINEEHQKDRLRVPSISAVAYLMLQTATYAMYAEPDIRTLPEATEGDDESSEEFGFMVNLCEAFIEAARDQQTSMRRTWIFRPLAWWWALCRGGYRFTLGSLLQLSQAHTLNPLPVFARVMEDFEVLKTSEEMVGLREMPLGEKQHLKATVCYSDEWEKMMLSAIHRQGIMIASFPRAITSDIPLGALRVPQPILNEIVPPDTPTYLPQRLVFAYVQMLQGLTCVQSGTRIFYPSQANPPPVPLTSSDRWGAVVELKSSIYAFVEISFDQEKGCHELTVANDHQMSHAKLKDNVVQTFLDWNPEFSINVDGVEVVKDDWSPCPAVAEAVSGLWAAQRAAAHVLQRPPPVLQYSSFRQLKWAMVYEMYMGHMLVM